MDPFLKWAGGKRWLLSHKDSLFPDINNVNRYFEPFLGGGSVFFHLEPHNALLSDSNEELINAYIMMRDRWSDLLALLKRYHKQHSQTFYYQIRSSKPKKPLQRAARFIYLNRTCWNGLYRVNQKGFFNVPIGTKKNVLFEDESFEQLSSVLRNAELEFCDFETTINRANENDFLFIDPPYTVKHNLNGFLKYNEKIFSWDDQVRLKDSIVRAINRGAFALVTNANHSSIVELYQDCGQMQILNRASVISGNSSGRGILSELAIKSW